MLFNTIDYVIFLPIVIFLYYAIPQKYRWILLLAASYFFYMSWKVEYIFLIIFSTLVDYFCGRKMDKLPTRKQRRPYLILSLFTNLGLLFAFKYFNFAVGNLNALFSHVGFSHDIPLMRLLLPVGISFYTFQTLSYSIDVYYGKQKAEKHLGYFALYVSFFPQLVAGPIERFSRLTPQFKVNHLFKYENLANGLRLILYGLFIKMVIADNISVVVDKIYQNPAAFSSLDIFWGIIFYSFQIYSDFYGYSIIAIGSALIMDIKIMDNFKTPYLSKNIAEFWQRRWMLNIMVVFVVSGFWHGANWTFIIWGALFGIIYLIEQLINKKFNLKKEYAPFSFGHIFLALKTFVLVTLIWVFFRSQSFNEAMIVFKSLFTNINVHTETVYIQKRIWIFLSLFIVSDIILYNTRFDQWVGKFPYLVRWAIYAVLLFAVIVFSGVENFPFIYFQF